MPDGERLASGVGFITLVIGAVLVIAPRWSGRLLGVGKHDFGLRVIGLSDLALVPGLLRGRPRWPWMAARGGFNLAVATYCLRLARSEGTIGAKIAGFAMVLLTVTDSRVAWRLRATG